MKKRKYSIARWVILACILFGVLEFFFEGFRVQAFGSSYEGTTEVRAHIALPEETPTPEPTSPDSVTPEPTTPSAGETTTPTNQSGEEDGHTAQSPSTGDERNMTVYGVLAGLALLVIILGHGIQKRKRQ